MSGYYIELYRRAREGLEADAESQLQRPLTVRERNIFRSCGTMTMLESLGMSVYCCEDADELAAKLAETSMESRFLLALKETVERLERLLGRAITPAEHTLLRALGNTEELWMLEEQVQKAAPAERETIVRSLESQVPAESERVVG